MHLTLKLSNEMGKGEKKKKTVLKLLKSKIEKLCYIFKSYQREFFQLKAWNYLNSNLI